MNILTSHWHVYFFYVLLEWIVFELVEYVLNEMLK